MTQRGLTLVEVLAATVLLAAMASVVMPLMQRAMRELEEMQPEIDLRDLADIADTLSVNPDVFGGLTDASAQRQELPWPGNSTRPPIMIKRIDPGYEDPDHNWLSVSCGGWEVYRWIPLDPNDEGAP